MQNHRQNTRQPVSVPAKLECGMVQVGGLVLDVSATGARLRLTPGAFLSNQCVLTTSLFAEPIPSRIVWRRGAEVGLRFGKVLNLRQELGASRGRGVPLAEAGAGGGFGRRAAKT